MPRSDEDLEIKISSENKCIYGSLMAFTPTSPLYPLENSQPPDPPTIKPPSIKFQREPPIPSNSPSTP